MTTVRYEVHGLDDMITEAGRVAEPDFRLIGRLERVLAAQFADTQARAHVITGSLRASGRTSSDYAGRDWTGSIEYGGPSPGPNNPVDYAIYEMARGGAHDFFGGLAELEPRYQDAITEFFAGD